MSALPPELDIAPNPPITAKVKGILSEVHRRYDIPAFGCHMGLIGESKIAMTARLIGLLVLTAIAAAPLDSALAEPAERRAEGAADAAQRSAEDATTAAKRDKGATEKLRASEPPTHKRRELRSYHDALERADRREKRSARKAADAVRDTEHAVRQAERARRQRTLRQRHEDRRRFRQRELDGNL